MKTLNTYYTSFEDLKNFVSDNNIKNSDSLLIQIFSSNNDEEFIASLNSCIDTLLPSAIIIGATTDGEIKDGLISTLKTVISFSMFDTTSLKTYISDDFDDYFQAGVNMAKDLNSEHIKVIISFIDGINSNGEEFLNGINSINSDIIISGGLAADKAEFSKTLVFTKNKILQNGVVGVALSSKTLHAYTNYSFNWVPIGLDLKITKAKGNRVYTINDKTAYETFAHYLGNDTARSLPGIGLEFPLILKRNGHNIARVVLRSEDDGSLVFAGNLKEGETVRFGYGNSSAILEHSKYDVNKLLEKPVESIFIYSCMARRRFMSELIENETLPYSSIAPTSGFFTYGEFYTSNSKEFLNESMTILTLSESSEVNENIELYKNEQQSNQGISIRALSNLIKTSSQDFEILNVMLENKVEDEIEKNRQKTKEIIEQKQLFETVFNKSKDGFLIIKENKLIDCNESAYKMLKYDSKDTLLRTPLDKLSPEYQADGELSSRKAKEHIEQAIKYNNHSFEWEIKQSDNNIIWIDVTMSNISSDSEATFFVIWKDINEKKKTEFKLEELTKNLENRVQEQVNELREKDDILFKQEREKIKLKLAEEQAILSNQAKSNFLANMSHEIRTPLNAILGFIDILFKEEISENKREKLKIVKESSDTLLTIINDILDFSKIESGKLSLDNVVFDTREPFSQICGLFFDKATQNNIKINLVLDVNLPTKAYGDITRIKQVFSNLLSNAIKFSHNNSRVDVNISYDKKMAQLLCHVKDYGIGIASDNLSKIFNSFEQADNSTTRKFGGTGLGLSISKKLVEIMGGELKVKSKLKYGSEFYFSLDLFSDIPKNYTKQEKTNSHNDTTKLSGKILLVEDNKTNQMLIKLLLDNYNLEADIANDGIEAIEAYKNNKYSLILMDENMPNMNGLEATRYIRELELEKDYKTPIVAVTANALSGERERFMDLGMDDYISKPIDQDEFENILIKYLQTL